MRPGLFKRGKCGRIRAMEKINKEALKILQPSCITPYSQPLFIAVLLLHMSKLQRFGKSKTETAGNTHLIPHAETCMARRLGNERVIVLG